MADIFYFRVDTSGLNAARRLADAKFSKRGPALGANTAMFFVMRGWTRDVNKATVPRIDSELAVEVEAVIGVRGKPLSLKRAKNRRYKGGITALQENKSLPLSVFIVLARANIVGKKRGDGTGSVSNYNVRTNNRFALSKDDLRGGRSVLDAKAHRMISSRHSATAFLASCGIPVIRELEKVIEPKYRRVGGRTDSAASKHADSHSSSMQLGIVIPAVQGEIAVAYMELRLGMGGGALSKNQNRALHEIGGPELQRQIDIEAEKTFVEVLKRCHNDELLQPLRQMGVAA